jgi:HlyD family secretion protein
MLKMDPTVTTISLAAVLAILVGVEASQMSAKGERSSGAAYADQAVVAPQWAASATGRIEPKDGEVRIASQVPARIVEVLAKTGDAVELGDPLVRLDDQDYYVKIAAAAAETGVREREREEEPAAGVAQERRDGEDAVVKAERALFAAREAFDQNYRAVRRGTSNAEELSKARAAVAAAKATLEQNRAVLAKIKAKSGLPLETRLESSLATARAELSAAEIALERTRVRAPVNGTVLNMLAREGETAVPSPESALVVFGDVDSLRVRAEVEERDASKVRVGQKVVVKSDAYPDREFDGKVTSISPSLGAPRIATRGPRRPNEVEVVEVMVALDGHPPLLTGMRVDTFFKLETTASATPPAKTN